MSQSQNSKTKTWLACTASAALIIAISTQAFAEKEPLALEGARMSRLMRISAQLRALSPEQRARKLTIRNVKGEELNNTPDPLEIPLQYATLDPTPDQLEGTSTEKTYNTFKMPRNNEDVIVAVIDSGVDINHKDLKGKIWVNEDEIPGNGIDDDKNGFVDDVNGWNFLGNSRGENVEATTLEFTREYARMKKKADAGSLSTEEAAYLEKVKKMYNDAVTDNESEIEMLRSFVDAYALLRANGLNEETIPAVTAFEASTPELEAAKEAVLQALSYNLSSAACAEYLEGDIKKGQFNHNLNFDASSIIGDNADELEMIQLDPATNQAIGNKKSYGNPNVTGPDASHGTHVSGIIAGVRNKIGLDGQAKKVKIMSIRAVPDGDERDKDVANAIRYAVNNGARVINMSFGKALSPRKNWVDDAVRYAEAKGSVVLVHAAGNDAKNTESLDNNFPHSTFLSNGRKATNWIEVGASDRKKTKWTDSTRKVRELTASFSNWGKTSVDLFAPGKNIYSTVPGNKYDIYSGTSMASPEVAGVAAILTYSFPRARAVDIRKAMMDSVTTYPGLTVSRVVTDKDGNPKKVILPFSEISLTGGIVNTYGAFDLLRHVPAN